MISAKIFTMSAVEKTINDVAESSKRISQAKPKTQPFFNKILDFLSSVRFGVVLLIILVLLSFVGMIIIQQNVNGFDAYFASLTPAEKWLFGNLGLFDVYHSWYFNFLLLVLSLNIVLASIDRIPGAWSYISKPKLSGTKDWVLGQKQNSIITLQAETETEAAGKAAEVFKKNGFKPQISENSYAAYKTDENGFKDFSAISSKKYLYVFGEKGRWNRMGAYIVHVALLLLFMGHFVALQTGFDADVRLMPGQTTNEIQMIQYNLDKQEKYAVGLPFTIICTDIEQKLIDPKGEIGINNTVDWRTQIKIDDPQYGATTADVQLNKPFNYRGYRFFQASAITVGSARNMTLELTPQTGGEPVKVNLARNGEATLPDGTKIAYDAFFADFAMVNGQPDTRSGDYNNPAVKLNVTTPAGEQKTAYAFAMKLPDSAPVGAPVAGYKFRLDNFEKSPLAHVLSIKYDPFHGAFIAWYLGGIGLIFALIFVFFISHQRVWALIEKKEISGNYEIVLGGDANRNHLGFEDKFKKLVNELNK